MTRINCVPVQELHHKHLVAEYRELPRVFALARTTWAAPKEYRLGAGHVLFFYDKLLYLYNRQHELYNEMTSRGYSPTFNPSGLLQWHSLKSHLWMDWIPTAEAIAINRQRLLERIPYHQPYHQYESTMGVSTHSTPSKCFIFSVYKSHRTQEENEKNHAVMADFFKTHGLHYIPVIGRYQGQLEEGFLVSANVVPEEAVLYYSRHYHQDNYMVLDNHKHGTMIASLVDCATREQKQIGFMRSMPEQDVINMQLDYTYRPDLKEYWVVWHTDTTVMTVHAEEKETFFRKLMRTGRMPSSEEPFGTPAYC